MSQPRISKRLAVAAAAAAEWLAVTIALIALATGALAKEVMQFSKIETVQDDIDDFVPYPGPRFDTFDWYLLRTMTDVNHGNLLISPVSLKLCLILLYEGAQNSTAKQLASAMQLPAHVLLTRAKFSTLLQSLKLKSEEYELQIGTRMYLDASILPKERYESILHVFYTTNIIRTNFSDTSSTAAKINDFLSNVTKKHINTLITDDSGLKDNVMFIVNAMYFHGLWYRQPFSVDQTKILPFYTFDEKTVQVPFMKTTKKFYFTYVDSIDAKVLRLPYAGHKFSMFIILPRLPGQVQKLMHKITPADVHNFTRTLEEIPIDVLLPKFKIEFTSHLEQTLRAMGIHEIFEETANLTGILHSKSTPRQLTVTDIVQKAGIEVSEAGTVAYTATEIEIGNKINDETFHANHSFLFYIEDERSGTILYMGVVNNPQEETGMAETMTAASETQTQMPPNFVERAGESLDTGLSALEDVGTKNKQNFFNVELLQKLAKIQTGNVVVGTSSVKTALMILAEAAAGQTYHELESSLRLSSDLDTQRMEALHTITPFEDATSRIELQNAIKLWLSGDVTILQTFTNTLKYLYKGDSQSVNFSNLADTVKIINDWAAKQTHGHITNVIDEGSLAADTSMILTTAVYFKGAWLEAFDKAETSLKCFDVPQVGCKKVPLMENVGLYHNGYVSAITSNVVQIPYAENKASLLIFLPEKTGERGLDDLLRDLSYVPMSSILENLAESELVLQIPRFSIKSKLDLRGALEQMGIRDLFMRNVNLTKAFPPNSVQLGSVIHNAQIDVNEEGTVASAITGVSVVPLMGMTATTFRVDRPFIFLLLDNQTSNILFAGRFVQPDAEALPQDIKA